MSTHTRVLGGDGGNGSPIFRFLLRDLSRLLWLCVHVRAEISPWDSLTAHMSFKAAILPWVPSPRLPCLGVY